MKAYAAEIEAGLAEVLADASKARICYASQLCTSLKPVEKALSEEIIKRLAWANAADEDLFSSASILVTTGWNKNDDVFLPDETWKARNTPEDKPFNYGHNEKDIIGHITGSHVIDFDNKIITDNPPDNFHIANTFVLYRAWVDADLKARMDKIIAEIPEGKWFVSMEALFDNFDYALTKGEEKHIVARGEESAFLTKYLRIYGGEGKYENYTVGRVLRNITFCGKGLVENPANPNSIIFTNTKAFNGVNNTIAKIITKGEKIMPELDTKVADLEKLVASLTADKAALEAKVKEHDAKAFEAEIKTLTEKLTKAESSVTDLTGKIEALTSAKATVEQSLAEQVEANKSLVAKVDEFTAAKVKSDRLAALAKAGLNEVDAEATYTKFSALSDEMFAQIVDIVKPAAKADVTVTTTAATAAVTEMKPEDKPALAATNDSGEDTIKALAEGIGSYIASIKTTKKANKEVK